MPGVKVGVGYIQIQPDMTGFSGDLKRGMSRDLAVAGAEGGKVAGGSLASGFKAAMAIGGATLGAAAVANFLQGAVSASSALNEQMSKTNAVFRESAGQIEEWAAGGAKDFGLSKRAALEAASTYGNMFSQLGIGLDQAAGMSTQLVELASDMASFHDADISQVLEAQAAGFRGEYDSLQRFLPLINAATVAQRAMELTGKKNAAALTAQDKALATNALIIEGVDEAAGDFDRTSDSLANRLRKLAGESENAKAKLGDVLAPTVAAFAGFLTDTGIPAVLKFGEVIGEGLADAAGFAIGALADLLSVVGKALEKIDQFVPNLEGVPEALKAAVTEMRSWEKSAHGAQSVFGEVASAADTQTAATQQLAGELKGLTTITVETADAQRDLEKATRTLGAANRDKADSQKDLNALLARGAVDEEAVADARERLADATRSAAHADLDLADAQETYNDAAAAHDILGLDSSLEAKEDAFDGLTDAQDRSTDAHESAAKAAKDLREAQAGDPDFQDKLADARDRVADATDKIVDAEKALKEKQAELTPLLTAQTDALKAQADQAQRLREEYEKLSAIGIEKLAGLGIIPSGFDTASVGGGLLTGAPLIPGAMGARSPVVAPSLVETVTGVPSTSTVNKTVNINVTQTDPDPVDLAHKMLWSLN